MTPPADPTQTPPRPRRKTRVWEDEDGWNYEVTHPDGHSAAGARLASEEDARQAAKAATFTPTPLPPDPAPDE